MGDKIWLRYKKIIEKARLENEDDSMPLKKYNEELFLELREIEMQLESIDDKQSKEFETLFDKYIDVRNELVVEHMDLATWVINNIEEIKSFKMQDEDKQQIALIGLMKAIEKFRSGSKDMDFATYACLRIITTIQREYERQNPYFKEAEKIETAIAMLANELGREPDKDEIEELFCNWAEYSTIMKKRSMLNVESLEELQERQDDRDTIFSALSDGDSVEYIDSRKNDAEDYVVDGVYVEKEEGPSIVIRDDEIVDLELEYEGIELREHIDMALSNLSIEKREMLELRYGLNDDIQRTRAEVGDLLGVTEGAVYSKEKIVLRKMRLSSYNRYLWDSCSQSTGYTFKLTLGNNEMLKRINQEKEFRDLMELRKKQDEELEQLRNQIQDNSKKTTDDKGEK